MAPETPGSLCARCFWRADSRRRVEEATSREALKPEKERRLNLFICDPAPRAECKWHEGYGHPPETKEGSCRDFTETAPPWAT